LRRMFIHHKSIFLVLVLIVVLLSTCIGCDKKEYENYYDQGVKAYNAGDLYLARSYFEKAEEYKDAQIYLEAIDKKAIDTTSIPEALTTDNSTETSIAETTIKSGIEIDREWARKLPSYMTPRIVKKDGKEFLIVGSDSDYTVFTLLEFESEQSRRIIDLLLENYPDRSEEEILELLKDPIMDY